MKNKVTLFNQVTGPLFIDIVNAFSKEYDKVTLVTGAVQSTYSPVNANVEIKYFARYNKRSLITRVVTWFWFYLQALIYVHRTKDLGRVLLVTNPPFLPFLGKYLSIKRGIQITVLVYDIYPHALSSFGYIRSNSYLFKYWERKNQLVYQNCEEVVTISTVMKDLLSKYTRSESIKVIYPWVDTAFIKPMKKEDNWFIKKHGLIGKKVVLYSGNMGITHDLLIVLEAAKVLQSMSNDIHFLFIGDGAKSGELKAFKDRNRLSNVSFLPYQDAKVLPYSFASADFGIVSLGIGAEELSVPSKTYYLLSAGAAIIAITEKGSEIERLVVNNMCGVALKSDDKDGLVNFLLNCKDIELDRLKENSRNSSKMFDIDNAYKFL